MKTTTTYIDDLQFQSINESGQAVDIDMRPADRKKHQSPTELLLSALSACSAVDLVQMLKKRRRTVGGLVVIADGVRRTDPPRAFTRIKLTFTLHSPDATQGELEKLGHLAATKYCSVAGTLNVEVEHEFVIVR